MLLDSSPTTVDLLSVGGGGDCTAGGRLSPATGLFGDLLGEDGGGWC